MSDETAHIIDEEIRNIVDRNYARAENILKENIDILHAMADALMKFETIDADQIKDIMEGKPPRTPDDWDEHEPTDSGQSSSETSAEKKDGKIGGPASEH